MRPVLSSQTFLDGFSLTWPGSSTACPRKHLICGSYLRPSLDSGKQQFRRSTVSRSAVGLIVHIVCSDAWVVPLSAKRAAEWSVEPTLPFRPAATLQNLLLKLLHTLNLPHIDGVPERFAFALSDPLGRPGNRRAMNGSLWVARRPGGRGGCCRA